MAAKHVFLSQIVNAREVIGSLIGLHALEHFNGDGCVVPSYVPLAVLALGQMVFEVELGDFFDNIVVRVPRIHDQSIGPCCDVFWI